MRLHFRLSAVKINNINKPEHRESMHKPANLYNNIGPHEHPPLILILRPKPKKHVIMPLASDAALQAPPCTQTTHHSIMLMAALPRPDFPADGDVCARRHRQPDHDEPACCCFWQAQAAVGQLSGHVSDNAGSVGGRRRDD